MLANCELMHIKRSNSYSQANSQCELKKCKFALYKFANFKSKLARTQCQNNGLKNCTLSRPVGPGDDVDVRFKIELEPLVDHEVDQDQFLDGAILEFVGGFFELGDNRFSSFDV